jgi:hypothetical protein
MEKAVSVFLFYLFFVLLHACAFDIVHIKQMPAQLEASSPTGRSFELDSAATVHLDTGYVRVLKKGTRWTCIGTIPEGDVYRTKDQVLTIEGSNIHEAYIVVKSQNLVGFYLPVEMTFSPLSSPMALSAKKIVYDP